MPDLVSQDCKNKCGECFVLSEEMGLLCCVGNLVHYKPVHGYEQPQKGETFRRRIDILAIKKKLKRRYQKLFSECTYTMPQLTQSVLYIARTLAFNC